MKTQCTLWKATGKREREVVKKKRSKVKESKIYKAKGRIIKVEKMVDEVEDGDVIEGVDVVVVEGHGEEREVVGEAGGRGAAVL